MGGKHQVKHWFRIGSMTISVESDFPMDCKGLFCAFSVPEADMADLSYRVSYTDNLPPYEISGARQSCPVQDCCGTERRFYPDMRTMTPFACTERHGSEINIQIISSYAPWGSSVEQLFPLLALHHNLLGHGHLLMHGAFLMYRGIGLLFTGPSGIGKTTQSHLWQACFSAKPVNEDRAVVDASSSVIRVCGVPVAGSSPFCTNETAPLKAIIVLAQSAENTIERLPATKALLRLMDSVYLPSGFETDQTACMELALRICSAVPVYRLSCRPDAESAELVYRTVFEETIK